MPLDRVFWVFVRSDRSSPDTLVVSLQLPLRLDVDAATQTVALPPFGTQNLFFRVRGALAQGSDTIAATARSVATVTTAAGQRIMRHQPTGEFRLVAVTHEYPHIPSQQFVRFAEDRVESVEVRVPPRPNVAYLRGTEDVRVPLKQLQVLLQEVHPALFAVVDVSEFTTVLMGADAVTEDTRSAAISALNHLLRDGGTVVVMGGRAEIAQSVLLPFPIVFDSTLPS